MAPPTAVVIDDDPDFRVIARRQLEAHGFEVVGDVPGPDAAVLTLESRHPDLVLLDLFFHGWHTADESVVRLRNAAPDACFVAVSASAARDEVLRRMKGHGIEEFVEKGDLGSHLDRLREVVSSRGTTTS